VKYTVPIRFGNIRFAENKQPLIFADGKEISMDAMEKLDPSTIESISVLKDSTSIKVYGKRGANGVILVNTQRGSKTKIQNKEISFSQKTTSTDAVPDFPVSGTVVDEQGRPKAGVSIIVPNTNHGTITDINGHFSLKAMKDGNLWFSFIGYKPVKASVSSTMNIRMEQEVVDLFPELSGSVKNGNSGFKVNNGVTVHGIKGEEPLVIIDGKETMEKDALSKLAPDHIKSISVLKDKSAQVVYGDKGKNGVIIVEMLTDDEYQARQNKR
ncbi:TonB-dependent receptor plug domain-containing protein, partial [Bacteroides ovatus]